MMRGAMTLFFELSNDSFISVSKIKCNIYVVALYVAKPHHVVMLRVPTKPDKDKKNLLRLGATVRARRMALELSQEALADYVEVDRVHIGRIERGETNITFLNLLRLASAIHCKPSELLSDAGF